MQQKSHDDVQEVFYDEILKWFQKTRGRDISTYIKFNNLAKTYGNIVYQVIFDIISNLKFEPKEASKLWFKIWAFKSKMEEGLNQKIDFRVALLEYLLEINHKIKSPKIIEMRLFEKTKHSIIIDELTGLYNYRFLENQIKYEIAKSRRSNSEFAIIFIDIDNFKIVNDSFGHEFGNMILKKIARIVLKNIRATDMAFRYGGDEFVVFLQDTRKIDSMNIAENLRKAVEHDLKEFDNKLLKLTISGGISTYPVDADSELSLLKNSDKALRISKDNGKNCINFFSKSFRSYKRKIIRKKFFVDSFSGKSNINTLIDLSVTGISFYSSVSYNPDSYCEIFLDDSKSIPFLIRIIRSSYTPKGYIIGGMFADMSYEKNQFLEKYLSISKKS